MYYTELRSFEWAAARKSGGVDYHYFWKEVIFSKSLSYWFLNELKKVMNRYLWAVSVV